MPSEKTSMTITEIDDELAEITQIINQLSAMQNRLPLGAAWNAIQAVRQVAQNAGQTLHDMRLGNGQITVVTS